MPENFVAACENFRETVHSFYKNSKKINNNNIFVSGGGRKNKYLLERIEKKINSKINLIDSIGVDGDFVESQAFGYLAIRSYLKLPITFPNTTGCSKPLSGGLIAKNF